MNKKTDLLTKKLSTAEIFKYSFQIRFKIKGDKIAIFKFPFLKLI